MRRLKLAFVAIVLLAMALQIPPTWAQEETITFMWCPPETGSLPATYDLVACTDTTNVIATAIASATNLDPVAPFTHPDYPGQTYEGTATLVLPTRIPYFVVARAVDILNRAGPWSRALPFDPGPPGGLRCGPIRL